MYISWLNEWFNYLKDNYNNQEVIENLNEAINDMQKYTYDCLNTLKEIRDEYSKNQDICPNCGYDIFVIEKSLEDTDLDGNRGRWQKNKKCLSCGEEIDLDKII